MKKMKIIFSAFFLSAALPALAQIPNSGFETLNLSGQISNWSANVILSVGVDSAGHFDSLVIDSGFYFTTTDAHSGARAMEMRNAHNFTTGDSYAGRALATTVDSDYAFFQTLIPISGIPGTLSFYYKYFPVGGEHARAVMEVYDTLGNVLGTADFSSPGAASSYTYASAAVTYTVAGVPAFATIRFVTCLPTETPAFGTRFIVDDAGIFTTTGVSAIKDRQKMNCYPAVATGELTLSINSTDHLPYQISINDASGKTVYHETRSVQGASEVKINVSSLVPGGYFVAADNGLVRMYGRFSKQ